MTWDIKQTVNFYLEEFQPPKIPRDLNRIIIGAGVHVALMAVLTVGLVLNWYWQSHRLQQVTAHHVAVEQQVNNLESERPPLKLNQALVDERADLRSNLESSQRILRYLTQQELSTSYSFTEMVAQLSEQDIRGVWLNRFSFFSEGRDIRLEGFTDDPAKVSRYVSSLLARPGYKDHAFRFVDVRKAEDSGRLSFRLDSRVQETPETVATAASEPLTSRRIMQAMREGRP